MKNAVILTAVAGLAAAASAQSVELTFSASATEINVGDTVTWTVSASYTGFAYFGGFNGDFIASEALGTAGNLSNALPFAGGTPSASGADVAANVFQSALLGAPDASIGEFFTFDVVATAEGDLSYSAAGIISMFASLSPFDQATEFTAAPVNSDVVSIVPAPGAAALLGLGGLVATRRRR